jgi:hypothetical protein
VRNPANGCSPGLSDVTRPYRHHLRRRRAEDTAVTTSPRAASKPTARTCHTAAQPGSCSASRSSKERRLEPQITVGVLTNQAGFPLMVNAFEGNKAETKTMLPVIESFMAAHFVASGAARFCSYIVWLLVY